MHACINNNIHIYTTSTTSKFFRKNIACTNIYLPLPFILPTPNTLGFFQMRIDIALTHHPTKIFQQHCHSSSKGYKLVATTLTSYKKRFFIYLHAQLHTNNIAIPYLIPASSPCLKSLHSPTLKFSLPPKNPNQYPSFTKQFTTLYSNISNFLTYFHIRIFSRSSPSNTLLHQLKVYSTPSM